MNQKTWELLSPAGDFSCMTSAFEAGADAVYLAGKSFGARAFAGNFETEELVDALDYAHLLSKKIYLTLNTLIKEKEFGQIAEYLTPFYEHGLDGVIIQDLGLIPFLQQEFPQLELHGSTQMTVSNWRSATWLKEKGICRVVPARELSLVELQEIKEKAGIEVEAFIHGAMCYSYSGQCLFSSFLGGRSGNRGRCAQPCRLPYKVFENGNCISGKKDVYPLSLKDLCSIPYIYELMDAGIDSFKIEGRMKSPEYVAGVTSIYRKYMDLYQKGDRRPIAKEDMELLAHLYIRSDMKDGYMKKHNGKDMISFYSPSYQGCDDSLVAQIHEKYCDKKQKIIIDGRLQLTVGKPAELTVSTSLLNTSDIENVNTQVTDTKKVSVEKTNTGRVISIAIYGDVVQEAQNRPLTKEDAIKQINKTGNSMFLFDKLEVSVNGNVFMPVKLLNELRRSALEQLQNKLLASYLREKNTVDIMYQEDSYNTVVNTSTKQLEEGKNGEKIGPENTHPSLSLSVMSKEQLQQVFTEIEKDLLDKEDIRIKRIYIPADLFYLKEIKVEEVKNVTKNESMEIYISLPRMLRKKDDFYLESIKDLLQMFKGVLVKSLEGLAYLKEIDYQGYVVTDCSIYNWNRSALTFLNVQRDGFTYPLELTIHENRDLQDRNGEYIIYGRTPMMITANCIRKTMDCCNGKENSFSQSLQDRYKKQLPVYTNCIHCYNEIFNAVPMSVHKEIPQLIRYGFNRFRLDFTNENAKETKKLLNYFRNKILCPQYTESFPLEEYTQGHMKEGAV